MRRDVAALLSRSKNPFFDHGEAEYFLAERDGAVVGRIAAISNRLHNETHGDRVGFFGFFECIDDQEVADALFQAAPDWCRARGHDLLRGPASFSVNDECGLLVDGFDFPPALMMPHNPRYYVHLVERGGFTKAKNLLVYQGGREDVYVPVPERLARGTEQFRPVVIPDFVPVAEKDGKIIGFGIALPDLNVVFRKNRSGRLLPVLPRLVWALKMRQIHRARILLLGVIPEYRGKAIDAMLYHWIWTRAEKLGFRWGEAGWILEDNTAMNAGLEKMTFRVYKTYRLYDRAI